MNFFSPYLFWHCFRNSLYFLPWSHWLLVQIAIFLKIEHYPLPLPFSVLGNTRKLISNLFSVKELEYRFIHLWILSSLLNSPLFVGLLLHHKPSIILPILLFYSIFSIWLSDHHSIKLGFYFIDFHHLWT